MLEKVCEGVRRYRIVISQNTHSPNHDWFCVGHLNPSFLVSSFLDIVLRIDLMSISISEIHYKIGAVIMSVTMHCTLKTKDECFDEFYNLAREELAFTRGSEGCISIQTSSSKEANTFKFIEIWENEELFNQYFEKRVERSGADFERLLVGPPEIECLVTDDWGYGEKWKP